MQLKYRNIITCLTIFVIMFSVFNLRFTYAQDDNEQVLNRIESINQSDAWQLPSVSNNSWKWLISDVLIRLFGSTWKIRSIFISAFNNLSINTIPLWTGTTFSNSSITQSGNVVNIAGDINIDWDLYQNTSTYVKDIWEETGSGIYYLQSWIDVGIGISDPQASLDVDGAVIVGDTNDACNGSKFGAIRFRNGQLEYCALESFAWVVWDWSTWSTTCGNAVRNRSVTCQSPSGSIDATWALCTGTEPNDQESSVQWSNTCGWLAWGGWSATCGPATRTRTCSTWAPGSAHCTGSDTESSIQWSSTCGWSNWGSFWSCSATCGTGTQTQTRTCTTGAPWSANCVWSATNSQSCSAGSSTCGWGAWGPYGACSATCGTGSQSRSRSCSTGSPGSAHCSGSATSSRSCTNWVVRTYDASVPKLPWVASNYNHRNAGVSCEDICKREYGSSSSCHAPGTTRLHGYLPNRNSASQSVASHWNRQSWSTVSLSCSSNIRPWYNDCPGNGWNWFTVPWCAHLSTNRGWWTDSTNTCICCDR